MSRWSGELKPQISDNHGEHGMAQTYIQNITECLVPSLGMNKSHLEIYQDILIFTPWPCNRIREALERHLKYSLSSFQIKVATFILSKASLRPIFMTKRGSFESTVYPFFVTLFKICRLYLCYVSVI